MISLFRVQGKSMEPFARQGDFVLAEKLSYLLSEPKLGHVIVARHPIEQNRLLLKRVTAAKDSFLWLAGDNKEKSTDSRHFGWVPQSNILGRALIVSKSRTRAELGAGLRSPRHIWLA